jgi:hypothetical protein
MGGKKDSIRKIKPSLMLRDDLPFIVKKTIKRVKFVQIIVCMSEDRNRV